MLSPEHRRRAFHGPGLRRDVAVLAITILLGRLLAAAAARFRQPRRMFLVAAAVGLAVSSVLPVQAAADTRSMVWLLALHAVVAVTLIPYLAAVAAGQRPAARLRWHLAAPAVTS